MGGKNNRQDLSYFKIAVFGMIIMILGMGIGRFFYTPVFPVMLDEGLFTFKQLSYIASANYGGYLVGSMFFSFCRVGNISRAPYMLFGAAIVTSALIFAMALTTNFLRRSDKRLSISISTKIIKRMFFWKMAVIIV
ncbi:YbfB/YjiJ family MFS transporter [Bartonella sp. AP331QHHD]|uniref:YbfB/YjiJ family MFS transporter n=1 Tax=Bartonella sp. AP331QHHD TaxID=3243490 RepID=UPI0035CFAC86